MAAPHAYASHENNGKRYNDGFDNGYSAAQNDNTYNPVCDPLGQYTSDGQHTTYYCTGWVNGYNAAWNDKNQGNGNTGTQQEQTSNINIRGNNNHVNVNQGQSSDSGNTFSPDNIYGNNLPGNNPSCKVICIS